MYQSLTFHMYHFDGRSYVLTREWPEKVVITKSLAENVYNGLFEIDENIVDITTDNGIARYYIVKEAWALGLYNDNIIYLEKFYGIINPLKLSNGFSLVVS